MASKVEGGKLSPCSLTGRWLCGKCYVEDYVCVLGRGFGNSVADFLQREQMLLAQEENAE